MSQHQEQGFLTNLPKVVVRTIQETMRFTDSRRESFVSELREWLETASASNNPIGLNAMAVLLSDKLRQIGMIPTIFEHPSGNAVFGEIHGENPEARTVLLLGHHDTVYAQGVSAPPVRLEGDRFYGPGSIDMKACLLQAVYALEGLVEETKYRDFNKILFLSLPDEEVPTRNHLQLLERLCQEHPFVLVLEGATSPGNIVLRRKGCAQFKLTARGVSAHAGSNPGKGRSAVLEIAHQTVQFCTLNQSIEGLSINAAPIAGGVLPNVVADFAEVSFDVRFLHEQDHHAVVAQWEALMKQPLVEGVTLTLTAERKPISPMEATEASLDMAQKAQSILSWLGMEYHPEHRGGGSDGCLTSALGCPTLDGFGAVGAAAHSPNEHILLPYVPQRAGLLAGMMAFLTTREEKS
ncbi:MAG: M20/M25/M40 family metallo-hydrolase [Chloroflexi bacterium]|nr:M20/M25/M40 family metallo-hydrolase [Chloroflexota bacterium]